MVIWDFISLKLDEVFLLTSLLILISFTKNNGHLLCIENYGLVSLLDSFTALDKSEEELFFRLIVLLQINFGASFHQIYKVHESINFFQFYTHLFKVSSLYLMYHTLQIFYLFLFECGHQFLEVIGF